MNIPDMPDIKTVGVILCDSKEYIVINKEWFFDGDNLERQFRLFKVARNHHQREKDNRIKRMMEIINGGVNFTNTTEDGNG